MKTKSCSCGKDILLDDEDFISLENKKLFCDVNRVRYWCSINGNQPVTRFIMQTNTITIVDHIDFDYHNNQKSNLRVATKSQNNIHQPIRNDNKTGYKGVAYNKRMGKFTASICKSGVQRWLGTFTNKEDAALAYNKAATDLFGDFAVLNKVENKET